MDRLWSPWRMEYIESNTDEPRDGACVFCALLEGVADGEPRILARDDHAFVTLAKYPYNPGHLLVLPTRHVGELEAVTADENASIARCLRRSVRALTMASEPHGF